MSHHTKYTEKEWLNMIRDCKSSGLSDQEWCREHHIVRSTFYKHLKRFHTAADDDGGRLPVKNLPLVPEEHEILPLIITEEPSCEARWQAVTPTVSMSSLLLFRQSELLQEI